MIATATPNEIKLIAVLRAIVAETMDNPPRPRIGELSCLPADMIAQAQKALAAYGFDVSPNRATIVWRAELHAALDQSVMALVSAPAPLGAV